MMDQFMTEDINTKVILNDNSLISRVDLAVISAFQSHSDERGWITGKMEFVDDEITVQPSNAMKPRRSNAYSHCHSLLNKMSSISLRWTLSMIRVTHQTSSIKNDSFF
jgi:hypothetical protein